MSDHYFTARPETGHRPGQVHVLLPDVHLELDTDAGMFSPARLDAGTRLLLDVAADPPGHPPGGDLLDLGCGYGPIALVLAARAPAATVWAVDVNERALALCARNAARAGLGNVRAVTPGDPALPASYAGIWSNPPIRIGKQALHDLLGGWLPRLAPGAAATAVVQRHLGSDSLHRWLTGQGWDVQRITSRAGYRVLRITRPAAPAAPAGPAAPAAPEGSAARQPQTGAGARGPEAAARRLSGPGEPGSDRMTDHPAGGENRPRQLRPTDVKRLNRAWRRGTQARIALLLDSVTQPFNVGSIVRTAAAFGVEHIWLCGNTAPLDHPSVRKTALGTERFLSAEREPSAAAAAKAAAASGLRVIAIELADGAVPLYEAPVGGNVCLAIGNEDHGCSPALLAACDAAAYIPQVGRVGSLNVAVAAAIALADARRREWEAAGPADRG